MSLQLVDFTRRATHFSEYALEYLRLRMGRNRPIEDLR